MICKPIILVMILAPRITADYKMAGISAKDINVAQVYDLTAGGIRMTDRTVDGLAFDKNFALGAFHADKG